MPRRRPHSATPALKLLEAHNIPHSVETFESGTDHFGKHAVQALAVEPERIFKTLIIDLSAGKGPKRHLAVCCLPVAFHLSLKKAATTFGVPKATMADPHDATRASGYIPGGISPIALKTPLPTCIDETAQLWDTIFVSGGRRGLDIELSPTHLLSLTNAHFADLLA